MSECANILLFGYSLVLADSEMHDVNTRHATNILLLQLYIESSQQCYEYHCL